MAKASEAPPVYGRPGKDRLTEVKELSVGPRFYRSVILPNKRSQEMIVTAWKLPCWQWCSTRKPNASPTLTAGSKSGSSSKASHKRTASPASSAYSLQMKGQTSQNIRWRPTIHTYKMFVPEGKEGFVKTQNGTDVWIVTCVPGQTSWLGWFYAAGQLVVLPVYPLKCPLLLRHTWKPQSKHLVLFHNSGNHQSPP